MASCHDSVVSKGKEMAVRATPMLEFDGGYVVVGDTDCPHCLKRTGVYAVMLLSGYNFLDECSVPAGSDSVPQWQVSSFPTLLSYVEGLDGAIGDHLSDRSCGCCYIDEVKQGGQSYVMNHCSHCSGRIGDGFLRDVGNVFFPLTEEALGHLSGEYVTGFGRARGSYSSYCDVSMKLSRQFKPAE